MQINRLYAPSEKKKIKTYTLIAHWNEIRNGGHCSFKKITGPSLKVEKIVSCLYMSIVSD